MTARRCVKCGHDLSSLPPDTKNCPYCGASLIWLCPSCNKDISSLPPDIKLCPYCGSLLSQRFRGFKKTAGLLLLAGMLMYVLVKAVLSGASLFFIPLLLFTPISPLPMFFIPYFAITIYLMLSKKNRRYMDLVMIALCIILFLAVFLMLG